MPIRKLNKNELKHQQKPWITKGIRKSIQRREILHKKNHKGKKVKKLKMNTIKNIKN